MFPLKINNANDFFFSFFNKFWRLLKLFECTKRTALNNWHDRKTKTANLSMFKNLTNSSVHLFLSFAECSLLLEQWKKSRQILIVFIQISEDFQVFFKAIKVLNTFSLIITIFEWREITLFYTKFIVIISYYEFLHKTLSHQRWKINSA